MAGRSRRNGGTAPGRTEIQTYEERLRTLSDGSVRRKFDAFLDIPWDDPAYAIDPKDPRWALPRADPLARTEWYRSLPAERRSEVGLARLAQMFRVGWQFENLLMRGALEHLFLVPNGDPVFRYLTHEVTEEAHHTQMFQEFVNRSGVDVPGIRRPFRLIHTLIPPLARWLPAAFFMAVLAGEEPIDHFQKSVLRSGGLPHPLPQRIMQIHVAEEARHISFAHEYLLHTVPGLRPVRRMLLSIALPLMMRIACDLLVRPSGELAKQVGIPREVMAEAFWDAPESRKMLRDLFADVRMLAERLGLMTPLSRLVWRRMGIAGRPARYRSEPPATAA
ncbi:AurF N-oxygenase family protein [Thermomonospora umbrina]|uniref:Para-aminobenzoate N-oxygenase AurF n=1 Tax=Thermomonospora umbrina TaxID=111806 RepID=A0A3D9SV15_9ACTN|nr:diiron oxygenase [Thermomonospora umbrina]REE97883.1 para-aminobenzoate N-oxygenase AurF [Thermomonospora umbrina]